MGTVLAKAAQLEVEAYLPSVLSAAMRAQSLAHMMAVNRRSLFNAHRDNSATSEQYDR